MSKKHDTHPKHAPHAAAPDTPTKPAAPSEPSPGNALEADLEKFRDLAMRTAADFDNYRKRATREKEEAIRYANTSLLEDLLPILDNFDLGMEAARSAPGADAILEGLGMVGRQFRDFLSASGVQQVATDGAEFDPNLMEAVGHEPDDKVPEGCVIRQTRRGYKLRDRLLRPASVVVSKGPPQ